VSLHHHGRAEYISTTPSGQILPGTPENVVGASGSVHKTTEKKSSPAKSENLAVVPDEFHPVTRVTWTRAEVALLDAHICSEEIGLQKRY